MRIIGCDLHARQQTLAMLDTTTGEVLKATLEHGGNKVREFYSNLPRPVRVGIEATGSMQWFLNLMEELGIECLVGHPAEIRAVATKTKARSPGCGSAPIPAGQRAFSGDLVTYERAVGYSGPPAAPAQVGGPAS